MHILYTKRKAFMTSISDSDLDRSFLDLSSKCVEPICWASWCYYRVISPLDPTKFDNFENKIMEVAFRSLLVVGAAVAVASIVVPVALIILGVASKVLRAIGFALQKNNSTHVRGLAPEISIDGQLKVMSWNVCGASGGLHYDHGGVISWQSRLKGMLEVTLRENPHVLVFQEIYDAALAEALIKELRTNYAHIFIHLGANVLGSVGGLMVLSKCAVHRFDNTSFHNNDWSLNRTFANLEIKARPEDQAPCARIIGTHLIHDSNEARIEQVNQIVNSIQEKTQLPTILVGDLNLERDDPEQGGILTPHFENGYLEPDKTRTQELLKQWDPNLEDPGDIIDYISLYRHHDPEVRLENVRAIPVYSADYNTKEALSDHKPVSGIFRFKEALGI